MIKIQVIKTSSRGAQVVLVVIEMAWCYTISKYKAGNNVTYLSCEVSKTINESVLLCERMPSFKMVEGISWNLMAFRSSIFDTYWKKRICHCRFAIRSNKHTANFPKGIFWGIVQKYNRPRPNTHHSRRYIIVCKTDLWLNEMLLITLN